MIDPAADRMLDRVRITEIKLAKLHRSDDLLLRFMFTPPPASSATPGPGATPSLQLTRQQARDLLLLLADGLGMPAPGTPGGPSMPRH